MKNSLKDCNKINFLQRHYISFAMGIGVVSVILMASSLHYHNPFCSLKYSHVNKSVVCGEKPVIKKTGYATTQAEIELLIEEKRSMGNVDNVSIYFRDLENGPIWGIDETREFTPASLLKLPLAMFYVIEAEKDPEVFNQKLSFTKSDESFAQVFSSENVIVPNHSYTVEELLMHMLAHSDNNAYELLQAHVDSSNQSSFIKDTYLEMGLISETDRYNKNISVRRYGSIFRSLYNSSYFDSELSEKVLGWLAESDFDQGLRGGVPNDIKIAHKFGERTSPNGIKQLHDCGIVYYPENPYLLCIMTEGSDYYELSNVIKDISTVVYNEVDSRRIN